MIRSCETNITDFFVFGAVMCVEQGYSGLLSKLQVETQER